MIIDINKEDLCDAMDVSCIKQRECSGNVQWVMCAQLYHLLFS